MVVVRVRERLVWGKVVRLVGADKVVKEARVFRVVRLVGEAGVVARLRVAVKGMVGE